MRKLLCAAALLILFATPAFAADFSADKIILVDCAADHVLYAKNADVPAPPASTTKLMTALCVIRSGCELEEEVCVSSNAAGTEGSSLYLREGDSLTVETLLYGLLLESGNDAAVALAEHTAGTVADFVVLMNQCAEALGLSDTHFANPHGLTEPGHLSSARDLARLMGEISQEPQLMQILATKEYRGEGRRFVNHNKLLSRYDHCDGGKTGYTEAAGRCLVTTAVIAGRRYVAVTLSAPEDWEDHLALYKMAEESFITLRISRRELTASLPVCGMERFVQAMPEAGLRITLPAYLRDSLTVSHRLPRFVYPGIGCGQRLGYAVVVAGGVETACAELYSADTVSAPAPGFFARLRLGILRWLS
ncbi:MAG: D-alanyl-D-alanine carboxypeptidase [Clostridia bacterium]|nr:D-alanyl-D-alanine carboxypeptidase [Clostridia bacterium]